MRDRDVEHDGDVASLFGDDPVFSSDQESDGGESTIDLDASVATAYDPDAVTWRHEDSSAATGVLVDTGIPAADEIDLGVEDVTEIDSASVKREEQLTRLFEAAVYGPQDERIGKVGQVYLDDQTGEPNWVTVKTGLFGTKEYFLPLDEAELEGRRLIVPYGKATVTGAPSTEIDQNLSVSEEEALYRYYEVPGRVGNPIEESALQPVEMNGDEAYDAQALDYDDENAEFADAEHAPQYDEQETFESDYDQYGAAPDQYNGGYQQYDSGYDQGADMSQQYEPDDQPVTRGDVAAQFVEDQYATPSNPNAGEPIDPNEVHGFDPDEPTLGTQQVYEESRGGMEGLDGELHDWSDQPVSGGAGDHEERSTDHRATNTGNSGDAEREQFATRRERRNRSRGY